MSEVVLRIGTSGWHYRHWVGTFYPQRWPASKMLAWYMERFDTVELNNSFYRLPTESALASWHDNTPANFQFAIKGSRFLTHMKKLKEPEEGIRRFFERADILAEKLGPVLFQLPPHWETNAGRLDEFLRALPPGHRYTFEFRHESWNNDEVLDVLRKHRAAYCIYHLAGYQSPLTVTTDLVYIRLHGPGGKYQGLYSENALDLWAARIKDWQASGCAVYVYFDNDDSGYAPMNALTLREKVLKF